MTGATSSGRFLLGLPDNDAALALSGGGNQILQRLEALTGASVVMRGLNLELSGSPSQTELAVALLELMRPIWEGGQVVSLVDLQAAKNALDKTKKLHKRIYIFLQTHLKVTKKKFITI